MTEAEEIRELRAERDALLQKPIDLAKMDSIDDHDGTPDKMVAYYWWQQAHDARAALEQADTAERMAVLRHLKKDIGWLGEATANHVRQLINDIRRGDHLKKG